eukprot:5431253-Amphidinium_carterae.1
MCMSVLTVTLDRTVLVTVNLDEVAEDASLAAAASRHWPTSGGPHCSHRSGVTYAFVASG